MNQTNKLIFKTAGYATAWVFVGLCYATAFFAMIAPGVMADLAGAMGDRGLDAVYTGRVYDQDPTAENLYLAFNKAIVAHDDGLIKKYGHRWYKIPKAKRDGITLKVDAFLVERAGDNPVIIAAVLNAPTAKILAKEYARATGDARWVNEGA